MGQYVILGGVSILEAMDHLGERPAATQTWGYVVEGIRFVDSALSDAECEALYVGYVPSGATDQEYVPPMPAALETHRQHLLDFVDAVDAGTDGSLTTAQLRHVLRDAVKGLFYLNKRLEDG